MITQERALPTTEIIPGDNDRTVFDPDSLRELASSIDAYGLAQPIIVREVALCMECETAYHNLQEDICPCCGGNTFASRYQIVAGERRFRAVSEVLGREEIPAIVRDLDDEQASGIMLAENVSRADLDPVDEALAYQRRIDDFGWTVAQIADRAGISAVRVRFRLKLLDLRDDVKRLVRDGHIQLGYAQVLADGQLDRNRQLTALSRLRDNPSPTPAWFRREVGKLVEEQEQGSLFDTEIFFVEQIINAEPSSTFTGPPTPSTTSPSIEADSPAEILSRSVAFWKEAAQQWENLGKPFKRQECEAAALALRQVAATMQAA